MREGPRESLICSTSVYIRCFCADVGTYPRPCLGMPTVDWGTTCALGEWGAATRNVCLVQGEEAWALQLVHVVAWYLICEVGACWQNPFFAESFF